MPMRQITLKGRVLSGTRLENSTLPEIKVLFGGGPEKWSCIAAERALKGMF